MRNVTHVLGILAQFEKSKLIDLGKSSARYSHGQIKPLESIGFGATFNMGISLNEVEQQRRASGLTI